jgi:peroxiredoxin
MKRLITHSFVIALLSFGCWLIICIHQSYHFKKKIMDNIKTLQHVGFESMAGGKVYLDEFGRQNPTVIVYFNPECEHCQYEATEISRHAEQFEKANTILITPEPSVEKVKAFAQTYHLNEVDNLAILLDTNMQFVKHFGTSAFPSVYIYDPDKKLVKNYRGEVKIEAIIGSLPPAPSEGGGEKQTNH